MSLLDQHRDSEGCRSHLVVNPGPLTNRGKHRDNIVFSLDSNGAYHFYVALEDE